MPTPKETVPAATEDVKAEVLAMLGFTAEEFDEFRSGLIEKRRKAEATPVDNKLKEPVRFWNDLYRGERVLINGKRRKFVNGQFLAETENELRVLRKMGPHVFEGDDLKRPAKCRVCERSFQNQGVYEDHISRHVVA